MTGNYSLRSLRGDGEHVWFGSAALFIIVTECAVANFDRSTVGSKLEECLEIGQMQVESQTFTSSEYLEFLTWLSRSMPAAVDRRLPPVASGYTHEARAHALASVQELAELAANILLESDEAD